MVCVWCAWLTKLNALHGQNPKNKELVPNVLFYDIPAHVARLGDLLKDLSLGEGHILLIGNQVRAAPH